MQPTTRTLRGAPSALFGLLAAAVALALTGSPVHAQQTPIVIDQSNFQTSNAIGLGFNILNGAIVGNTAVESDPAFLVDDDLFTGLTVTDGAIDADSTDAPATALEIDQAADGDLLFFGGIENNDLISATSTVTADIGGDATAYAIRFLEGDTAFSGGIENTENGRIDALARTEFGNTTAYGILVEPITAFAGGLNLQGEMDVQARSEFSAILPEALEYSVGGGSGGTLAQAYGIEVVDTSIVGSVVTAGNLAVTASHSSNLVINGIVLAVSNAEIGEGSIAEGVHLTGDLLTGSLLQQGTLRSNATSSVSLDVNANSPGSAQALIRMELADAEITGVNSAALGYGAEFGTMGNPLGGPAFANEGELRATAASTLSAAVDATAVEDATARIVNDAGDPAEARAISEATGVRIGGSEDALVFGDVVNELGGSVFASATSNVRLSSTATAEAGTAIARAPVDPSRVFSDSTGLEVRVGTLAGNSLLSLTGDVINRGSISGLSNALLSAQATASGALDAGAEAQARGTPQVTAVGGQITAETLFGTVEVAETGSYSGQAFATGFANANATSTGTDEAAASTASATALLQRAEASGTGLRVATVAMTGDVEIDGSVFGNAAARISATATATGAAGTAATSAAAQSGVGYATGQGAIVGVGLMTGDVINNAGGSITALAAVSETLTATSTGGDTSNAQASTLASLDESYGAHATGLQIVPNADLSTLLGDVRNAGEISAEATSASTSSATASSALVAVALARNTVSDARAFGVVVGIDAVGEVVNLAGATITAKATNTSLSTASGTTSESDGTVLARASAGSTSARAAGVLVGEDSFVGGEVTALGDFDNAGSIQAEATASATQNATATGDQSAIAFTIMEVSNANAWGVHLQADGIVGPVDNDGTVTAAATALQANTVLVTTPGEGRASVQQSDVFGIFDANADSDGIKIETDLPLLFGFTNRGSIGAQATATVAATATLNGDLLVNEDPGPDSPPDGASALVLQIVANADGVEIENGNGVIAGGVRNVLGATIESAATASRTVTATQSATSIDGSSAASTVTVDDIAALSDGIDLEGPTEDSAGFALLTGGVANAATIRSEATVTSTLASTANADEQATARMTVGTLADSSFDPMAEADGIDLAFTQGVIGGIANSGGIAATANATWQHSISATTTAGGDGDVLASADAALKQWNAIRSEATGIEVTFVGDADLAGIAGDVVNSNRIDAVANASTTLSTTATSGTGDSAASSEPVRGTLAYATGIDLDLQEQDFPDAEPGAVIEDTVRNAAGAIITAKATAAMIESSMASGPLGATAAGSSNTAASLVIALAQGLVVDAASVGRVENGGSIDVVAQGTRSATVTATASDGDATAELPLARGSATAYGIAVSADTLEDGIDNSGGISAQAVMTVTNAASATTAGSGETLVEGGTPAATAAAIWVGLAEFPFVNTGELDGGFRNAGTLLADAKANLTSTASTSTTTEDTAQLASVDAAATAKADGAYISVNGSFDGGVINAANAAISATSAATASRTASTTGSTSGVAELKARMVSADSDGLDLEGFDDPIAAPIPITVLNGGVTNDGSIAATATGTSTELASVSGVSGSATLSVPTDFRIGQIAMRVESAAIDTRVSEALHDGLTNSGLLQSTSSATRSATATIDIDGEGTASVQGGFVQSLAYGIEFDADSDDDTLLDGGASNSGTIGVGATTTVATTATATGAETDAQALTGLVTTSATGIDLDLAGAELVFDPDLQDDVLVVRGGAILGDVVNTVNGVVQVTATSTATATATAATSAFVNLGAGALTEAVGFSIETLSLNGNVGNAGAILATASGTHGSTASAAAESGTSQSLAKPVFESLAQGIYLTVDEAVGDFTNAGGIAANATEEGTASATSTVEEGGTTIAQDHSRATAHGLQLKSPDVDGDFANLAGGEIDVDALARSTVTINAGGGSFDTVAQGFVVASGAGLDLQPDSPLDLFDEESLVGFVPLAAYDFYTDPEAPGLLTGRFDNAGIISVTVTASALATFTVGDGPHLVVAAAAAVAQGMGSSVQTIEGGVGNWGFIEVDALANAALNSAGTTFDGEASRSAVAYGILLVAPQATEDVVDQFLLQVEPAPLGLIGDADGDGISVENHGTVSAAARVGVGSGGSPPDIQEGPTASYAAALQIGRGTEIVGAVSAFTGDILLPPDDVGGDGMVVSGDLLNTGTLAANATAPGLIEGDVNGLATAAGIALYDSEIGGSLDNSGLAAFIVANATAGEAAAYGILVENSVIAGGINTTGLVKATATGNFSAVADAINTVNAAGATVINVLDGNTENDQLDPEDNPLWTGDNLVGIIGDIRLADSFGDTVNWSGGDIQGDIVGSGICEGLCAFAIGGALDDVVNVFAGVADSFDYDGLIFNMLAVNVNTTEHAATPVELTLRGSIELTAALNVNDNGTLVIGKEYEGFFDAGNANVDNYNHADAGTVLFEIGEEPGESGFVSALNLNIAGGLIGIRPTGAFFADEAVYEVIYAGTRTGAFAGTVSPSPLLQVAVEYGDYDGAPGTSTDPTPGDVHDAPDFFDDSDSDVRLTVTRVPFDEVAGLTPNQKAVAGAIEDVFGPDLEGTEFGDGIAFLFLTDDYQEALSQLHGAEHAQTANLVGQLSGLFAQWLADRRSDRGNAQGAGTQSYAWSPALDQIAAAKALDGDADAEQVAEFARGGTRAPGTFSVWFGGGGLWGNADSDPAQDVEGFDQRTWGGMAGIDYQIDGQFLVGLAGLYQTTTAEFDDDSESDVDSFQVGLYGSWDSGTFYVDGLASVGWSSIDSHRRIVIPMVFDGTAKSDTDAFLLTLGAEVGYAFRFNGGFSVTPLAGLDYRHASIDGYKETGASPYNLDVEENDVNSLTSTLGFAVGGDFDLGGMKLSPELRAAWQHEFLDSEQDITASFVAEPGANFTAVGSDFGADAGLVGAGLTLEVSPGIEAFVDYNGRFSGGYNANAVSGGLRVSW